MLIVLDYVQGEELTALLSRDYAVRFTILTQIEVDACMVHLLPL